MKLFTEDNTEGYTEDELNKLNDEWIEIIDKLNLEEFTDEYYTQAKIFSDEIARRMK